MSIFNFLDENGIKYNDRSLIEQAFIHSSYVNEHKSGLKDNERLEFMGDAVLQIWVSYKLYYLKPALPEGKMTVKRSNLVNEKALASYVREYGFSRYLKLGQGEEKTGGRNRDSVIADMFEALTGAIYLDTDYDNVAKFLDIIITHHIDDEFNEELDYKTKLQEYVQSDSRKAIVYETEKISGPSNDPEFTVAVKVDGLIFGRGTGQSKKEAQKQAAKDALLKMAK